MANDASTTKIVIPSDSCTTSIFNYNQVVEIIIQSYEANTLLHVKMMFDLCHVEPKFVELYTVKPLNSGHHFCRAFIATNEVWPLLRVLI